MKKGDVRNSPSKITLGDVFDDIGLTPGEACEAKIKTDLWRAVVDRIEEVNYSQGRSCSICSRCTNRKLVTC